MYLAKESLQSTLTQLTLKQQILSTCSSASQIEESKRQGQAGSGFKRTAFEAPDGLHLGWLCANEHLDLIFVMETLQFLYENWLYEPSSILCPPKQQNNILFS